MVCAACNLYRITGKRRIFEVFSLPQIHKTLEYRRARFNAAGQNLEQLTRQAWGQFATHVDRAVSGNNHSTIAGMRGRYGGADGFYVHGARFNDGQGVGTIPMAPAAEDFE